MSTKRSEFLDYVTGVIHWYVYKVAKYHTPENPQIRSDYTIPDHFIRHKTGLIDRLQRIGCEVSVKKDKRTLEISWDPEWNCFGASLK